MIDTEICAIKNWHFVQYFVLLHHALFLSNRHAYILKTVNNHRRGDALVSCAKINMLRNRKPEITLIYI